MKVVVPDLISNSYFPAVAAVDLGFFKNQGIDATLENIFPVDLAFKKLRDGEVDFVAGSAHAALVAFPEWKGVQLLSALSQGMYWFLVLHADIGAKRGDIDAVKGLRIGAAPLVDLGLKRLLTEAGIDIERDGVDIAPVPGAIGQGISFGVTAAKALEAKKIDGFWANGFGAETAVRLGVGDVILDVRRGDGPPAAFSYTMPVLATTERLVDTDPQCAAGAVRAIVATQTAIKNDIGRAVEVGNRLFPAGDAEMIADVVERDLPYYDAAIDEAAVVGINRFAQDSRLLSQDVPYDQIVATQFSHLWAG